jgi:hypothetical protein
MVPEAVEIFLTDFEFPLRWDVNPHEVDGPPLHGHMSLPSVDDSKGRGQRCPSPNQGDGPVEVRRPVGVVRGVWLYDHHKSAVLLREVLDEKVLRLAAVVHIALKDGGGHL